MDRRSLVTCATLLAVSSTTGALIVLIVSFGSAPLWLIFAVPVVGLVFASLVLFENRPYKQGLVAIAASILLGWFWGDLSSLFGWFWEFASSTWSSATP